MQTGTWAFADNKALHKGINIMGVWRQNVIAARFKSREVGNMGQLHVFTYMMS